MTDKRNDHKTNNRALMAFGMRRLSRFLKERFSLEEDKATQEDVIGAISRGVEFRGVNLWVLIFATFIASLGLNVNSTAVIIGAMLISPLMGPIMGMGLSLGINDFDLFKKSLRNFGLMVIVSMLTSTVYFAISPISSARSELLARTVPTTYDVLIAFFGGLAGIVAQSRKDRTSTIIPGVAIATALMPPLCTAGFGLATRQWSYFIGAFYLFFINTVFIALATHVIVRFMNYDKKTFLDKSRGRRVRRTMLAITLITFIPSIFVGVHMVRVSIFENNADKYVASVFDYANTSVVNFNKKYKTHSERSHIELLLIGEPLSDDAIENARKQLERFGLKDTELVVRQASKSDDVTASFLQEIYSEQLGEKNRQIAELSNQLVAARSESGEVSARMSRTAMAVEKNASSISVSKNIFFAADGSAVDTVLVCVVTKAAPGVEIDVARLEDLLGVEPGVKRVKIYVEEPAVEEKASPADSVKTEIK